jgi:atrazine chlorohydrolase/5-methylthioadenosine/S-adenosylhomocysteine deaminase/melamine deaminase
MFFDRMDGRIQGYVDALKARSPQVELCSIMEKAWLWPKIGSQPCQISIMARQGGRISVWPLLPLPRRGRPVEGMRWAQAPSPVIGR